MSVDVEKYLEDSLVLGLRSIFAYDDQYTFAPDIRQSKILITSTFPEKEATMMIPQIVVNSISYEFSETSLFQNYLGDIIEAGIVVGHKYSTLVSYSAGLTCIAPKDGMSKDIANKVANYINFDAREVFDDIFGLNVKSVRKSPGAIQRRAPDNTFAHSVSVSGVLNWIGEKRFVDPNIIKHIKTQLTIKKHQ